MGWSMRGPSSVALPAFLFDAGHERRLIAVPVVRGMAKPFDPVWIQPFYPFCIEDFSRQKLRQDWAE